MREKKSKEQYTKKQKENARAMLSSLISELHFFANLKWEYTPDLQTLTDQVVQNRVWMIKRCREISGCRECF